MIINRVKERREQLGLSQGKLAKKSGVSQGTISLIEANDHMPKIDTVLYLAHALDCTVDELYYFNIKYKNITKNPLTF